MDKSSFSKIKDTQFKEFMALQNLGDILRWGFIQFQEAELYYGHGTDNAWDEIIYLVLAILKLGPVLNSQCLEVKLTQDKCIQIFQKIKQRIHERIPTAYLVNQAWFAGLSFYVDPRVLIPRSPMAELIEQRFSPWISSNCVNSILDLGTGSACIAIACAYAFPYVKVDAIDCSKKALDVASINIRKHKLSKRVKLIESNGFENIREKIYDIIISNPPYVDAEGFAQLPPEYKHEPAVALAAGKDGLDLIVQLLDQAKHHLKKGGLLIVEVGNSKPALIHRFPHLPFVWLEFEHGDAEVFLLTREQLVDDKEI
ncbi:MAG: 50S ribosomal protein L3 N(5)-glutamine methyltransferase [Rickettsiella sp.]|nr:50S ribosomal protein L3 N(5)-glutamine methyltransferase [Rickettsiella sp.]